MIQPDPCGRPPASLDDVSAALRRAVAGEPDVIAAYVFGSVARADAGPLSDVDVALLLAPDAANRAVLGRVEDALSRELRTSRIDVVDLREAPMPLRYRIARDGVLTSCRDAARLERFTVESVLRYLDFKPIRDRAFAQMRRAILERA